MGTDIHMYAEVRVDDDWHKVGNVFEDQWRQHYLEVVEVGEANDDYVAYARERLENMPEFTDQPWQHRSYRFFAALADVRNGRGFAGVKTGERCHTMCDHIHRIDRDHMALSGAVQRELDGWGVDAHSRQIWRLSDIIDYRQKVIADPGRVFSSYMCITWEQYVDWCAGKHPEMWSGMSGGRDVVVIDHTQPGYALDPKKKPGRGDTVRELVDELGGNERTVRRVLTGDEKLHVKVRHDEPYEDALGASFDFLIKQLQRIDNGDRADGVRIVCWFDS